MGLFSSGSTTSGTAQKWVKPFAKEGLRDTQNVVNANAGGLQALTGQVSGLVPDIIAKYRAGSPSLDAAQGYVTDVLGGQYMGGNPYLESMIGQTAGDVTSRVGAAYGSRGSFGGTAYTQALAKGLADSENSLRYGNYSDEMNRMASAAGMAPSIAQGQYSGLPEILNAAGVAAEIPYSGINAQANNVNALSNGSKTKGPGFGSQLLSAGASAAGAYFGSKAR